MNIAEIVLCSVALCGCIAVAVMFFKALDIPPECCAPSEHPVDSVFVIESELIQ